MPKIIIGCLNHPKKDCFAYCKKGCSVTLNCDCIGCKFYKSKRQYNEDLIKHDIALSRATIRSKDAEIEKLKAEINRLMRYVANKKDATKLNNIYYNIGFDLISGDEDV